MTEQQERAQFRRIYRKSTAASRGIIASIVRLSGALWQMSQDQAAKAPPEKSD